MTKEYLMTLLVATEMTVQISAHTHLFSSPVFKTEGDTENDLQNIYNSGINFLLLPGKHR